MIGDLTALTDQELAEHQLALHGQLEQLHRERARRWQVAQADRQARGVAWCEDGEHEVPIADIIRGQGDYDDVCRACGAANIARHYAATYGHDRDHRAGKDAAGGVCNWEGKGTEVDADEDGPICPRCHKPVCQLAEDEQPAELGGEAGGA